MYHIIIFKPETSFIVTAGTEAEYRNLFESYASEKDTLKMQVYYLKGYGAGTHITSYHKENNNG